MKGQADEMKGLERQNEGAYRNESQFRWMRFWWKIEKIKLRAVLYRGICSRCIIILTFGCLRYSRL
jgi:hypothetical protein